MAFQVPWRTLFLQELWADFDGNNVYEVTVKVADGYGGIDTQDISVTVTNQAITSVTATGTGTVAVGSLYSLNLSADEDATG